MPCRRAVAACCLLPDPCWCRWLAASNGLLSIFRRELSAVGCQHPAVREALLPPHLSRLAGGPSSLLGRLLHWLMSQIFVMLSSKYAGVDAAVDPDQVTV